MNLGNFYGRVISWKIELITLIWWLDYIWKIIFSSGYCIWRENIQPETHSVAISHNYEWFVIKINEVVPVILDFHHYSEWQVTNTEFCLFSWHVCMHTHTSLPVSSTHNYHSFFVYFLILEVQRQSLNILSSSIHSISWDTKKI